MIEIYRWFSQLDQTEASLIFGGILLFLATIPLVPIILKIVLVLIRKEKSRIITFKYALSEDHFLGASTNAEYYKLSPDPNFIVEGGLILLTWHVTGAFRIDIEGVGKKLKGNSAYVLANRQKPGYELVAYTLEGKKKAFLVLPWDKILNLGTAAFSRLENGGCNTYLGSIETYSFTGKYANGIGGISTSKSSFPIFRTGIPKLTRDRHPGNVTLAYGPPDSGIVSNHQLNNHLDSQVVVRAYPQNPERYHENGEHIFYHSSRNLREQLRKKHAPKN